MGTRVTSSLILDDCRARDVHRAFTNIVRDKMVITARVIEVLLMGLCVVRLSAVPAPGRRERHSRSERVMWPFVQGGIFYQMDTDNVAALRSRSAALYCIVSLQPYLIMLATIVQCTHARAHTHTHTHTHTHARTHATQ
jgi:hypothetical protein